MRKILAIIPARGGSKGLPRKNILPLDGSPLIGYTIQAALESSFVDRVVASTEDDEIAEVAQRLGAEVPFLRPMELAVDHTPGIDPILYTIRRLEEEEGYLPELVMLLQPTSPLRGREHIDEAVKLFQENQNVFKSLISVTPLEHPTEWNRIIRGNSHLNDFVTYSKEEVATRQQAQQVYRLNGAIYMTHREVLLQNRSFETKKTLAYVMNNEDSVDIDTQLDFDWAEFLMKKRKSLFVL